MQRFSISLRVWLIGFVVLSAALAWWSQRANRQRRAVSALEQLGATVHYSFEVNEQGELRRFLLFPGEEAVLKQTGKDCWYPVHRVDIPPQGDAGLPARLTPLAKLTDLRKVVFYGGPITNNDVQHLRNLTSLRELEIWNYGVAPFEMTPEGQVVAIHHTLDDGGLESLQSLQSLEHLTLTNVAITDGGLRYLQELPNLKTLTLTNTLVTEAGKQRLLEACPNLVIEE